jgi:broad specificity phosphatase PhoE
MKIYLIRHGRTTGDDEDRYGGDYDDHLTEKGKQQSQGLADKLKGKGIEIIYHSSRIRATETSQILSKNLGLELKVVPDLRERNHYGVLTGLVKSEAKEKYPSEVQKLADNPLHHHVEESEAYSPFKERVTKAFVEVTSDDAYSTIAIISHGGPIKCIIREVLKAGELKDLNDCAILEIDRIDGRYKLVSMDGAELE